MLVREASQKPGIIGFLSYLLSSSDIFGYVLVIEAGDTAKYQLFPVSRTIIYFVNIFHSPRAFNTVYHDHYMSREENSMTDFYNEC